MKKHMTAIFFASALLVLSSCRTEPAPIPEDFEFSVGTTTQGRTIEYHSEGDLIVKSTEGSDGMNTAELVLTDEQMQYAWELLSAMELENYPDAPELYDPQTAVVMPSTDVKLWLRADGQEKMIWSEDISLKDPKTENGMAYVTAVSEIIKMITGTEEYLAMPEWVD